MSKFKPVFKLKPSTADLDLYKGIDPRIIGYDAFGEIVYKTDTPTAKSDPPAPVVRPANYARMKIM